jgi:mannose-1-phosphate guanylyltransferase
MVDERTLFATSDDGVYWLDTGTPETYIRAQLDVVEGRRTFGSPSDAIGAGARLAATAVVESSVIGADVVVGADAEIVGSIVQRGASIGARARIVNSIVGERTTVGDGAIVEDVSVIGAGENVPAGAVLQAARVPESES